VFANGSEFPEDPELGGSAETGSIATTPDNANSDAVIATM
jgi:hypothetical protein